MYLDDILIFSETMEEHVTGVRLVLQRLLENRLFAKAEKCEFHQSTVQFLGSVVARGRLKMDPSKTKAVVSWPTLSNRKELQRFLGFANFYRRFIRGFSSTIRPLTARSHSSGHRKLRQHLRTSRPGSPRHLSWSCLTQRSSSFWRSTPQKREQARCFPNELPTVKYTPAPTFLADFPLQR